MKITDNNYMYIKREEYASLFLSQTYNVTMDNKGNGKNEYWSDKRPYYIVYQDKMFLKDISAQLFIELPDVGEIAYIGATSHKLVKDYSLDRRGVKRLR